MSPKNKLYSGYTLIELMLVVTIISIVASIMTPHFDLVLQRANQAKTKANLGHLRSAMHIYYADQSFWPLNNYPDGLFHLADGNSLTNVLVPKYTPMVPAPKLKDRVGSYNGIAGSFDDTIQSLMEMNPPHDVYILRGEAAYTPGLISPYAYDCTTGEIYIPNGNTDVSGIFFFDW